MEYTFRELKASDMGQVCKILSLIGMKEIKNLDIPINGEMSKEEMGIAVTFSVAGLIMENIPKAQKDIDKFLSSVTGLKIEEINEMSLGDYGELIVKVVQKDEFKDFFGHVWKLFNH